ncbi:ornithine cyclodeaminase family protein [Dactylosporangium sp. CA-233914]|uniref:ornithine cyclodeaminase family protein n=1 Tax=Dactylosporangium sp. CA-233914 TaxID=3239934 RepID=UPI003D9036C6
MLDAVQVRRAVGWRDAVAALRAALAGGLDPEAEPARLSLAFGAGEVLAMPSGTDRVVGVKLVSIVPGNPARGLPRIHGVYVLFDAATLAPAVVLDGTALTALRTPAVSALGLDLVAPAPARRLVVFGTGPQAYGHVHALRAVRPIDTVDVVGRDATRTDAFAARLRAEGIAATAAGPDTVAEADVVACCTTARTPLFDGRLLPDHAVVVAVGSHEPDAREVDSETVRRCGALVESRATALTEAGDVVRAVADGAVRADDLVTLADLVRGTTVARPRLVKTVGMGWEDLVVAAAVVEAVERS